jgi:hypothetical protein
MRGTACVGRLLLGGWNYRCLIDRAAVVDEREKYEVSNPAYEQKPASAPEESS